MAAETLFFVHVSKTGGTSVARAIIKALGPDAKVYPYGTADDKHVGKVEPGLLLERARDQVFSFVSVHMPAWTAAAVAPSGTHVTVLRDPVTRTISHLQQAQRLIRSHGFDMTIEELYDDPHFRQLIVNYQVWIFACPRPDSPTDWKRDPSVGNALLHEAQEVAAQDPHASPPKWMYEMATHRHDDTALDEQDLAAARRVLESFHAVGITPELERFSEKVTRLSGLELQVPHRNKTSRSFDCPEAFRQRILEDNALEAELYDAAVGLSQ